MIVALFEEVGQSIDRDPFFLSGWETEDENWARLVFVDNNRASFLREMV